MEKNIFEEEKQGFSVQKKSISFSMSYLRENSGFIMAAFILLVVIVVMTTDVRAISIQNVKNLSLSMFALIVCFYGMHVIMYRSGMLAGEKLEKYKKTCAEYEEIRADVVSMDNQKPLAEFCKNYIETEHRSRIEEILISVNMSFDEFEDVRDLPLSKMKERGIPTRKILRILEANYIRPIKLTPEMLCQQGKNNIRRGAMHDQPADLRKKDHITEFVKVVFTSGALGVIVFEVFSNPSWATVGAVAFKVLTIALTGYFGYARGYDNIVIDTVLFMQDQITMLKQFKSWLQTKQKNSEDCICVTESW